MASPSSDLVPKIVVTQKCIRRKLARKRVAKLVQEYSKTPDALRKRHWIRILKEIESVERNYVANLKFALTSYRDPIAASGIVNEQDIATLFAKFQAVYEFASNFEAQIKERLSKWPGETRLSDLFLSMAQPMVNVYAEFVSKHEIVVKTIEHLKHSQNFCALLTECQKRAKSMLDLESYLIMPVQHLPRYELLLVELYKHSDPEHIDYANLEKAIATIRRVNTDINEITREEERLRRALAHQNVLVDEVWEPTPISCTSLPPGCGTAVSTLELTDRMTSEPLTNVWALTDIGRLVQWHTPSGSWRAFAMPPNEEAFASISVTSGGLAQLHAGRAVSVAAVGASGGAYLGIHYPRKEGPNISWKPLPGTAWRQAVIGRGGQALWAVGVRTVGVSAHISMDSKVSISAPLLATYRYNFVIENWEETGGVSEGITSLAIGGHDGYVVGHAPAAALVTSESGLTAVSSRLYERRTKRTWAAIYPAFLKKMELNGNYNLKHVCVMDMNNIWAVDLEGKLLLFNGHTFTELKTTLRFATIAASPDGDVLGLAVQGNAVWRLRYRKFQSISMELTRYTSKKVWDDRFMALGVGHKPYAVSLFKPLPPCRFSVLGDYAERGYINEPSPRAGHIMVVSETVSDDQMFRNTKPLLVEPASYELLWNDEHTTATFGDCSIWRPVPPDPEYIALGCVVNNSYSRPTRNAIKCVHKSILTPVAVVRTGVEGFLWASSDTRQQPRTLLWLVGFPEDNTVPMGTFIVSQVPAGEATTAHSLVPPQAHAIASVSRMM